MKNDQKGLDEMQRAKRNQIGNQMFQFLAYLLMIEAGLSGFGVRWLAYPANVMAIVSVCMCVYLARIFAANAYFSPEAQKHQSRSAMKVIAVIATAAAIAFVLGRGQGKGGWEDDGALILLIIAAVGLIIPSVVAIIRKFHDRKEEEES